jgi:hypothetical protein
MLPFVTINSGRPKRLHTTTPYSSLMQPKMIPPTTEPSRGLSHMGIGHPN